MSRIDPRAVRVAFKTLGCKVNRVESEEIASELLGMGVVVSDIDEADVVIVNTCTVTGEADAKARKAVRQALNSAGSPLVVVTGCLASLDAGALSALGDKVVVEAEKSAVATAVASRLGIAPASRHEGPVPDARRDDIFRTRVPVKIQDGCDAFCSYCIVPYARGVPRSVPLYSVVARVRGLVEAGVAEVVFTGINLGRYVDEASGADLADLVRAIGDTGIPRLRLSSIEPAHLTARLLDALACTSAVCAHLHVPLQSGDDDVLRAMGRGYSVAEFEESIAAARAALPGLAVTTDVIVGFPGETDEQASRTVETIERIGFSKLHVFRYSERAGTPAASMPDSVPAAIRSARAAALRAVSERLESAHAAGMAGRPIEVLVEHVENGIATGTSREYLRISMQGDASVRPGDLIVTVMP